MRNNKIKKFLRTAVRIGSILPFAAVVAFGQQQINLTAGPTTATMPDGTVVPMWGYSCGAAVGGSGATCAQLNPTAGSSWSPVVITIPTGAAGGLSINLTNSLQFGANKIPTSIMIVGQLGGGLGGAPTRTTSPVHPMQTLTWPASGADATNTPPAQPARVQSFGTEVDGGTTTLLPAWGNLRPGTYLLESGTHPSIQGPMGLYGMLVVTGGAGGDAYPGVPYAADVNMLMSEIDPVQNKSVDTAVRTAGFEETKVWSGLAPSGCGYPSSPSYNTCYPPAVNYTPLYFLINGTGFSKTNATASVFPTVPAAPGANARVLVRLVNAGSRMHIPSIVGSKTTGAVPGMSLIAEDGNVLPGTPRIQSQVFMAAGKTYDVLITAPATGLPVLPIYDRQGSLSANGTARDAGMLAYIGTNGALAPTAPVIVPAAVVADSYTSIVPGKTLIVSDPAKGVINNDTNVYGVKLVGSGVTAKGTLTLNLDGTFTYVANAGFSGTDIFTYQANGTGPSTTITLGLCSGACLGAVTANPDVYTSKIATSLSVKSPGVLLNDTDSANYPLTVAAGSVTGANVCNAAISNTPCVSVDPTGGFNAYTTAAGSINFNYKAVNSQGTLSAVASVTVNFPAPSNLSVTLKDSKTKAVIPADYRWIIEEDKTFFVDPAAQTNVAPVIGTTTVPVFGTNFHTSYMPVVASGCVGTVSCEAGQSVQGAPAVCDVGNGVCRTTASTKAPLDPSQVALDPTKRYYISILPGDGLDPGNCGTGGDEACPSHAMGGSQIAANQKNVTVYLAPTPLPPAKVSVFVFEDDNPLNGEQDTGGGVDVLAPNEPGLAGFNITLFDDVGGPGDAAGQMTYDMFNMPLSNALAGTIDPSTGRDACPVSRDALIGFDGQTNGSGITGVVPVCPKYEEGGTVLSPLAGQAVIANLPPGRYGVVATPGADRIAKGEEWLQTNTLDGGKAHDSFVKASEPGYFQEYGPAGYHVVIGFANPKVINDRKAAVCENTTCTSSVIGKVTGVHMSRTPDERLYSTGSRDIFSYTQCYVSLGSADGADFVFSKCDENGNFNLANIPAGNWRVSVFDQWNDQIVDGYTTPIAVGAGVTNMHDLAVHQWKSNLATSTFVDTNGNGVRDNDEKGLPLVYTNVRFRDGSYSNFNSTDLEGNAGYNEVFPLFNWYVVETDSTRYKNTGTHVVYDAGGPVDDGPGCGATGQPACSSSNIGSRLARTLEEIPLPGQLRFPGSFYCANADCTDAPAPLAPGGAGGSTGRVDPPWVTSYGWQGFIGQGAFLEFGKRRIAENETGGIHGHVVYASTRPFDDPALLLQLSWEPMIPNVTMNLYQKSFATDGVTSTLKLVDTTKTSSFDAWAQGFRSDGIPNMNCPGQARDTGAGADLFFFTLKDQSAYLDLYNSLHGGPAVTPLPYNSQFKCYDGMHNWNQMQPAPYDGMYEFPSIIGRSPTTGIPVGTGSVNGVNGSRPGTNCTICVANPVDGTPMLPEGKYVVEMIVPDGYELVKEEDKNILMGDTYIAPVTQQFAGAGNIFIMPDQAAIAATYNPTNSLNPTTDLGANPTHEGDTGSIETFWPCVGALRVIPDWMSLFPGSGQNAPFAGATRPLCDRKEVNLDPGMTVLAKFYVFTSTHVAAHFTGQISDDFTAEFDPFSPAFGEKSAPPNMPVSLKDWTGQEVGRVYSDQWGVYNGLNFSSYGVNPPDPSGYVPQMMVTCMNDIGNPNSPDPLYNPQYSQFCYEIPFMPGQTQYMDTPVVAVSAFAGSGYNNPDCAYPDATPAVSSVVGDERNGPWSRGTSGHTTLTITALGDLLIPNNGYTGPKANVAPYNQKKITRHFGFGASQGTGSVTIGGVTMAVVPGGWSDTTITINVPLFSASSNNIPLCAQQQQAQYGGSNARCGELVITAGNGKKSIDTVTVTVGGKVPTPWVAGQTIQAAIDAAQPGDLILVPAGGYTEIPIMWKPVRLQGVGAVSTVINASTHPSGVLDPWRARMVCLFGLALNGQPQSADNPYDPSGVNACGSTNGTPWEGFHGSINNPQVDRMPLEGILGWDAQVNGNLAQQLSEPTLLGAYEGAGITVVAKGVRYPAGANFIFGNGPDNGLVATASQFPMGTSLLTASNTDCITGSGQNGYASNFLCNPSRIDGLSVTNSSQGGGGILVHGWGHTLEISNNRIHNNTGTISGGITIGLGEAPDALLAGNNGDPVGYDQQPWTCKPGFVTNAGTLNPIQNTSVAGTADGTQVPFCWDRGVNIHDNAITSNSSIGDELFSATPAGAGGVTFCPGSDGYKLTHNWICGNLSGGDGAGVTHLGYMENGTIEKNFILFNQSTNPTVPTHGGGIIVMSTAPDGLIPPGGVSAGAECGAVTDVDCGPGLGDGTGPGLVIDANLIMGNSADSGSGGGIRFQGVNGTEVSRFPLTPNNWYEVNVTNNIITNNVAGWDGAGVSLVDSLKVNLINNTIASNDSTATSGALFLAFRAQEGLASAPIPGCTTPTCLSAPQPAGVSTSANSAGMTASLPALIICPAGHTTGLSNPLVPLPVPNGTCRTESFPILYNNVIFKNRSFNIDIAPFSNSVNQSVVTLTPTLNQTATGACMSGAVYWDLGARGDLSPTLHGGGVAMQPVSTVLTSTAGGYTGNHNLQADPTFVRQYCNGSRVPPEFGGSGYLTPPGTNEGNVPIPVFNLTAAATVDEGNNWINISWGPLAMTNAATGTVLGNYAPAAGSPVLDYVTALNSTVSYGAAPNHDFFGNPRKVSGNTAVDAGAVEGAGSISAGVLSITPTSATYGTVNVGSNGSQTLTLTNNTGATVTGIAVATATTAPPAAPAVFTRPAGAAGGTCGTTLTTANNCTIIVVFTPVAGVAYTGTATVTASTAVLGSPVALTGTGFVTPTKPTLPVLDNFNRANANTLGGNWSQLVVLGNAGIGVNTNRASCTAALLCSNALGATAFWNVTTFGATQSVAYTFTTAPAANTRLFLKATGGSAAAPQNAVRVSFSGGTVTVDTTTNGLTFTTAGTITGVTLVTNDTITARVSNTGLVQVWKTTGVTDTYLGSAQLPNVALWTTGGGRLGIQMSNGSTVDNFAGGNF